MKTYPFVMVFGLPGPTVYKHSRLGDWKPICFNGLCWTRRVRWLLFPRRKSRILRDIQISLPPQKIYGPYPGADHFLAYRKVINFTESDEFFNQACVSWPIEAGGMGPDETFFSTKFHNNQLTKGSSGGPATLRPMVSGHVFRSSKWRQWKAAFEGENRILRGKKHSHARSDRFSSVLEENLQRDITFDRFAGDVVNLVNVPWVAVGGPGVMWVSVGYDCEVKFDH